MKPPTSRADDSFVVEAAMDLAVAIASGTASGCNGGAAPKPLAYEVEGQASGLHASACSGGFILDARRGNAL